MSIQLKRAYEPAAARDGERVLVDRLWPRGLSKESARIDLWLRELAPSDELRKWFGHRPEFFPLFRKRYLKELSGPEASRAFEQLYHLATTAKNLTLLYAAKDDQHNNAVVLKELLEGMRKPPTTSGPTAGKAAMPNRARMSRRN
jgi:uncharacterized protein YeaO (DUF488 family)